MKRIGLILALLLPAASAAQDVISSLISPGPLSKAHAALDASGSCTQCHQIAAGVPNEKCLSCHKPLAQRILARQGFHGKLDLNEKSCIDCHSDHQGRDFDIRGLDFRTFDHKLTGWPLRGKHAQTPCRACHGPTRTFLGAATVCASCHKDPHQGQFAGRTCDSCHGATEPVTFKLPGFDHGKTRYPLAGEHLKVACKDCHAGGKYRPLRFEDCSTCHKDPHKGQFGGRTCQSCHAAPSGWKAAKQLVDHEKTRFPLQGAHARVPCESCHKGGRFRFDSLECKACHEDRHKGQFGQQSCKDCHTLDAFKPSTFQHARARFGLTGLHLQVACQQCHQGGKYKPLPFQDCSSCHKDPHKGQFAERRCDSCHNTQGWKSASGAVDHDKTRFPLTGKHVLTACQDCHKDGRFHFDSLECKTCHQDVHKGQFPDRGCESCHNTAAFKPSTFDHSRSAFPLVDKHVAVPCASCHTGGTYRPVPHDRCSSCHQDVHKGQFGAKDCASCHTPGGWKEARFESQQEFALPSAWQAPPGGVQDLPQGRALQAACDRMLIVPQERPSRSSKSRVPGLPHARGMETPTVSARHPDVPAGGPARHARVRGMPQTGRSASDGGAFAGLCQLPSRRACGATGDPVRDLSPGDQLEPGPLRARRHQQPPVRRAQGAGLP